jgi:hypothetical protein
MPELAPVTTTTLSCMASGKVKSHFKTLHNASGGYVISRMKSVAKGQSMSRNRFRRTKKVSSYSSMAIDGKKFSDFGSQEVV